MANVNDFEMFEGDTKIIRITVMDKTVVPNVPLDISGASFKWMCAKDAKQTGANITASKATSGLGITITDGPGGVIDVLLQPVDTAGKKAMQYYHEAEMTQAGVVTTVYSSYFLLKESLIDP